MDVKLSTENPIQGARRRMQSWDTAVFFNIFAGGRPFEFHKNSPVAGLTQFLASQSVTRLMITATRSGDGPGYLLLLVCLFLFAPLATAKLAVLMVIAFAIELPLYKWIKSSIRRERPYQRLPGVHYLIQAPDHFSFPSGHTAAAVLVVTLLSAVFAPTSLVMAMLSLWALLVGLSRVYLGVHYPSDILAGALLGWSSAQAALNIMH